jgi:SAM-dependent methyltransferase
MEVQTGNIYNFPRYYDLVFGSDWKAEFDFLQECFRRFATKKVHRLFEPACGTGRLLFRLAQAGYRVSGLDLNPHAIDYCNDRLERYGRPRSAFVGDMADFGLSHRVDAAFNTINSFRHLPTEESARDHLQCIAKILRKGGIYVLGLHLTPTDIEPIEAESWSARRGNLCVNTRLWTVDRNLKRRQERFKMTCDVHTPTRAFRIEDTITFRTYTVAQMKSLIASVPQLALGDVFDFAYDLRNPLPLDGESEDVVLILHKEGAEGQRGKGAK